MLNMLMVLIFEIHGLPTLVVSKINPCLVVLFWQGLFESLNTMLKLFFSYHPQMNWQSEIVVFVVPNLMKNLEGEFSYYKYCERYLPLVDYAYISMKNYILERHVLR